MMSKYYILFYKTVADYVEKRTAYRAEHLKYAMSFRDDGRLVMAGALADPADGALLIFKGNSPELAREFARNDPYVKNGLITEWEVREWTVVIGDQ